MSGTIERRHYLTLLDAAVDRLAAAGDASGAGALIALATDSFPDDIETLHRCGIMRRRLGDIPAAMALFERVLELLPGFHFTEMEIGSTFAQTGQHEAALAWFRRAMASDANWLPAYLFAARVERRQGRGFEALSLLDRALEIEPGHLEVAAERASILASHGQREAAIAAYRPLVGDGSASSAHHAAYLDLLNQTAGYAAIEAHATAHPALDGDASGAVRFIRAHARLAAAFDRPALIARAAAREGSATWVEPAGLQATIRRAIDQRRPFSLVRFGDGEARFLASRDPAVRELLGEAGADAIGRSIWSNWFGEDVSAQPPAHLEGLVALVRDSLRAADVVGLPSTERLRIDHHHFGFLAYLDELATRLLQDRPAATFADAAVNLALHRISPFYADLLAGVATVVVISPHSELAARIGRAFAIREVVSIVIPGERRLPEPVRAQSGSGHFPDRFQQVMTGLAAPQAGRVFLVAGGLLGKIYCATARQWGGVAIDIGSLADAWMGFDTRPGQFEPIEDWLWPDQSQRVGRGGVDV